MNNSRSQLYHADVHMPSHMKRPVFRGKLMYGEHAVEESKVDRYGAVVLPEFFFGGNEARCIEVEYDAVRRQVVKQVWRQPLDDHRDLVLVIGASGRVRTVWVNLRSDQHRTLDTSKYVRA